MLDRHTGLPDGHWAWLVALPAGRFCEETGNQLVSECCLMAQPGEWVQYGTEVLLGGELAWTRWCHPEFRLPPMVYTASGPSSPGAGCSSPIHYRAKRSVPWQGPG